MKFIRRLYGRETPADERVWHKWNLLMMPVSLKGGGFQLGGTVWRRLTDDGYEYQARQLSDEEWSDRQW